LIDKLKDFASTVARPFFSGIGCILCFHRIVRDEKLSRLPDNRALEITPGALRAILDWVRRRELEVIRLDEVKSRIAQPRGGKFIAFTFDDGYRDNLTEALPIFRDFGFPFAVNVATGYASRTASAWWYSLEDILHQRTSLKCMWDGQLREWSWSTPAEQEAAFTSMATMIRAQGRNTRDDLIQQLSAAAGIDPMQRTRDLMMHWEEIKHLATNWHVTIGSHTVGHHTLNRLDPAELKKELIDSRIEIEGRLDRKVQHLAYPFGGPNAVGQREFEAARECDYLTAVTTRTGNLFPEHAWHLQALPRLSMSGNYPVLTMLKRLESGLITARANRWKRLVVE
jgi:peptidoglycan/xylan/chitin deacetylase (PgdA/CDA1 family)